MTIFFFIMLAFAVFCLCFDSRQATKGMCFWKKQYHYLSIGWSVVIGAFIMILVFTI